MQSMRQIMNGFIVIFFFLIFKVNIAFCSQALDLLIKYRSYFK